MTASEQEIYCGLTYAGSIWLSESGREWQAQDADGCALGSFRTATEAGMAVFDAFAEEIGRGPAMRAAPEPTRDRLLARLRVDALRFQLAAAEAEAIKVELASRTITASCALELLAAITGEEEAAP